MYPEESAANRGGTRDPIVLCRELPARRWTGDTERISPGPTMGSVISVTHDLVEWLLDSDPALRWQVQKDLLQHPRSDWEATRAQIATEGFGARLLALQDEDGQWAGGAYFPGDFDWHGPEAQPGAGQPWTATTWTLNTLREWGMDPAPLDGSAELLERNSRWEYDDLPYWGGEVDCCINAFTLANGAWLGVDVSGLLAWFPDHQMDDGGWDCEWVEGSVRSSYHSTLNSLKGLLEYEALTGQSTREIRRPAEEFLLERELFRRKSTGEPVADWVFEFAYPFRWRYSVLNAAEYFRKASAVDGLATDEAPDQRMESAIGKIEEKRQADGTWLQDHRFPGRVWFEVDVRPGEPSKWLTLYASRVLRWWDSPNDG